MDPLSEGIPMCGPKEEPLQRSILLYRAEAYFVHSRLLEISLATASEDVEELRVMHLKTLM